MVKEARRGSRGPKGQKPQKELRTNPSLSSEVDASGRPHLLPHRRGDAHRGEQLHPRPGLGGGDRCLRLRPLRLPLRL